jgi:hypothetical protein
MSHATTVWYVQVDCILQAELEAVVFVLHRLVYAYEILTGQYPFVKDNDPVPSSTRIFNMAGFPGVAVLT